MIKIYTDKRRNGLVWDRLEIKTNEELSFICNCFELLGDDDGEDHRSMIGVLCNSRVKVLCKDYTERIIELLKLGDVEYVDLRN
jgi:hypothetical protein